MRVIFIFAIVLALLGCGESSPPERILGRAVVGERELSLLKDLNPRSEATGKAKFGETIEILKRRRRFCQVKSPSGAIGWIDGRSLIRAQDMEALEQLRSDFRNQPNMGRIRVYENLNVHAWPNRNSPSFDQIVPGERADILGHRIVQRAPFEPVALPKPPAPRKKGELKGKKADIGPPPAPVAPKPPEEWRQLSKSLTTDPAPIAGAPRKREVRNLILLQQSKANSGPTFDDWTLIRTQRGGIGWALSRLLIVDVPEELLNQTRRQRITAQLDLGEVRNAKGEPRPHVLLATRVEPNQSFQFDAFRVLLYNTRRQRYEAVYSEKDLRGYLPVLVSGIAEQQPAFTLVIEDEEGRCFRRRYLIDGGRVKYQDQIQVERPKQPSAPDELPPLELPGPVEDDGENSWWSRLRRQIFGK